MGGWVYGGNYRHKPTLLDSHTRFVCIIKSLHKFKKGLLGNVKCPGRRFCIGTLLFTLHSNFRTIPSHAKMDRLMLHRPLIAFLVIVSSVLIGCATTQTAAEDEERDEFVSTGVAAIAGETAGWENTISGDDVDQPSLSITEQALHGQVAGVEVLDRPGGGIAVRIRGVSSIMAGTDPLYVVDGMPVLLTNNGLDWLNVKDIKKIEVIKDIDAKALYGARGANGVVLITTKLGPDDRR